MFKKINWKKVAEWFALILAAIGGTQVYDQVAISSEPVSYEAQLPSSWDSDLNYKVTASFYKESQVKVGNFTDGKVEKDGLGVYSVYVSSIADEKVIEAFSALTGYTKVGIQKKIKVDKKPGFQGEDDEPEDELK